MPDVVIILGSPGDLTWSQRITEALQRFELEAETRIASAHKTPGHLLRLLSEFEGDGKPKVYITVAGRSNALSGFVDAAVTAPVIACPPASDSFGGMDILSTLRMPSGVAPLLVLEPQNAALAAAKILSLADPDLRRRVERVHEEDGSRVTDADGALQREKSGGGDA